MKVTAGEIADLLSSAPPRKVSAHLVRAANRNRGTGSWLFFGLIFGLIGALFTALFFPWGFQNQWRLDSARARTTPGVITAVNRTGTLVNKVRVMEYVFNFTPEDGRAREGRCFTTGAQWTPDAAVTVRYLPSEPDVACVQGARVTEVGWGGMFVLLVPLLSVGMLTAFVRGRRGTTRLLRDGQVAEVNVLSVTATGIRSNKQTVYKIVLSSSSLPGGQPLTVRRTNPTDVNLAAGHAQRQQTLFVLYDLLKPKQVLFPEALIDP
jgi:hypothetical protein